MYGSLGAGNCYMEVVIKGLARLFGRSEEHTSELQSRLHLVCRLLLEKKSPRSICTASESGSCSRIWRNSSTAAEHFLANKQLCAHPRLHSIFAASEFAGTHTYLPGA